MTQESYCSFETAKLLKEKGYVGNQPYVYTSDGKGHVPSVMGDWRAKSDIPYAPQSMAMRWLREVHNIHITISFDDVEYCNIATGKSTDCDMIKEFYSYTISTYDISCNPKIKILRQGNRDTYEEAAEAAILYTLKNLI